MRKMEGEKIVKLSLYAPQIDRESGRERKKRKQRVLEWNNYILTDDLKFRATRPFRPYITVEICENTSAPFHAYQSHQLRKFKWNKFLDRHTRSVCVCICVCLT